MAGDFVKKRFYDLFLGFLILLNTLPILAPILAKAGFGNISKVIYTIYSFLCHQFHWRSVHIYDYQIAWCTRDQFIWGAFLLVALITRVRRVRALVWYWVIPFVVPIALDGGIQTIATILGFSNSAPFYVSNNFLRMVTGTIFGTGIALWMMPMLRDTFVIGEYTVEKTLKNWMVAVGVFMVSLPLYLGFVAMWNVSSNEYLPTNIIDSEVKTPARTSQWFVRRANGL